MCSIIGALVWSTSVNQSRAYSRVLNEIFSRSMERGRDGRGWLVQALPEGRDYKVFEQHDATRQLDWDRDEVFFGEALVNGTLIGNMRAEPTTEYVKDKRPQDQQPYRVGPWTIVHNGTIANDKELRTHEVDTSIDSAAIVELLAGDHMLGQGERDVAEHFARCVKQLHGSFAILALHRDHPGMVLAAANYRPIWFARYPNAVFFGSARDYLPDDCSPQMLEPYSAWAFTSDGKMRELHRQKAPSRRRALVVCSGGLDSVVAATYAQRNGFDIELIHFQYGSRAEGPEVQAVQAVAQALQVPLRLFPLPIYRPEDSPLLRADSAIAGGEAGAEFAHEWVPARNLAMLAITTAVAEAGGFDTIVLGNNLEEAGAYPDNEPEFIARFNDLLPFAVADGKRVRVIMPVGNMMKHEIVAMGHRLGAPLDKTWSCYRAGPVHCGTCGPCYMRRTAFEINGLPEVIPYANEKE